MMMMMCYREVNRSENEVETIERIEREREKER